MTDVLGDKAGQVTGVLTVEAFVAREEGSEPTRIPVVPYSSNTSYHLDRGATLRNIL